MKTQKYDREFLRSTGYAEAAGLVLLLTAANCFGQQFRVLEPNGGQSYEVGGTMTIRWSGGSPLSNVTILLSYNSGGSWPKTVVATTRNDGLYEWTSIDATPSTHCRIAVGTSLANADTSDGDFTIRPVESVHFNDPKLKAAVKHQLNITHDPTEADMLGLIKLDAGGDGVSDLTGLEYATNLDELVFYENQISDLSPLAGLSKVRIINFFWNQISDLSPLAGLTNLVQLDLQRNNISDISRLVGLTNLYYVQLGMNQISDLSPLAGLTNLTQIELGQNQISDISPLGGLRSLWSLHLEDNHISDLSPLAGLTKLKYLRLHDNQISDISPLAGLAALAAVSLSGNPLNQEAYSVYIPQITANNPGVSISYDPCIQAAVPNVVGMTQSQAEAALQAAGLVLGTVWSAASNAPLGTVISQDPSAGTMVNGGSAIDITLSSGPEQVQVTVPNLFGMTRAQAEAALQSAGLVAGAISWKSSDKPQGTVVEQNPDGGETASPGAAVDLTFSQFDGGSTSGPSLALPNPVAHWKLDESTSAVASDAIGRHPGTVRGNPLWRPSGGKIGGALWLDGLGDYVEIAAHSDFDLTERITVAAWILVEAFDKDSQAIVTKGDSAWRIQRNAKTNAIEFGCNTQGRGGVSQLRHVLGDTSVNDGRWHHVAGTSDGNELCLYVDDVLDASVSSPGRRATNSYNVRIGDNSQAQGRYWKGLIDDVRIYDVALNQSQIRGVMTGSEAWVPTGSIDIGTPVKGSDSYTGGICTVVADGADIWGGRDEFHYVYASVTGDFEFSAHVLSLENTNPWAKAGVMVRETLDAESRHTFMCVTPEDGEGRFAFQCRPAVAGLSTSLHTIRGQVSYPANTWVKIKRQGNSFTALTSQNGTTWTKFIGHEVDPQGYPDAPNPVTIAMPEIVYIGLAVTSHSNGQLCTAEFGNVQLDNPTVTP